MFTYSEEVISYAIQNKYKKEWTNLLDGGGCLLYINCKMKKKICNEVMDFVSKIEEMGNKFDH